MPKTATATKGQRRRAEILDAARQLLVEEGYDRFVLREIAIRTDMTLGNLQYYFRTRDLLLEAVVRTELERNLGILGAVVESGQDAEAQLRDLARSLVREWSGDGGKVYAVLSFLSLHQVHFRDVQRDIYSQFYEQLISILQKLRPDAHRGALLNTARVISAVLDGAPVQLHSGAFPPMPEAREHFIDDICDQVVRVAKG